MRNNARKMFPHHSVFQAHGRDWFYTHSIGEYLADEKKPFSEQRFSYVATDKEADLYAAQQEQAADARYALRMFEYYD